MNITTLNLLLADDDLDDCTFFKGHKSQPAQNPARKR